MFFGIFVSVLTLFLYFIILSRKADKRTYRFLLPRNLVRLKMNIKTRNHTQTNTKFHKNLSPTVQFCKENKES